MTAPPTAGAAVEDDVEDDDDRPRPGPGSGPFDRRGPVLAFAVLVSCSLLAVAWVVTASPRATRVASPTTTVEPAPAAPISPPVVPTLPLPPRPEVARGEVVSLAGGGALPEGWRAVAGEWATDDRGIMLTTPAADGPSLAVAEVEGLPWATVSFTGEGVGPGWGLVLGYQTPDDRWELLVEDAEVTLVQVTDGERAVVHAASLTPRGDVTVTVDVSDRLAVVRIGADLLPTIQLASADAARTVGVVAAPRTDVTDQRWASVAVNPRVPMGEPLISAQGSVREISPAEAREHLGA